MSTEKHIIESLKLIRGNAVMADGVIDRMLDDDNLPITDDINDWLMVISGKLMRIIAHADNCDIA